MDRCSACGKRVELVYGFKDGSGGLCLDCAYKHTAVMQQQQTMLAAYQNSLIDRMEMMTGVPLGGRIQVPQPIINTGQNTHNFISIDKSIVGSVNTGMIKDLNVSMNNINNMGYAELVEKMSDLVEKTLESNHIKKAEKEEIIELANALTKEFANKKPSKPVVIAIWEKMKGVLSPSADLTTLVAALYPYLEKLLKSISQ